MRRIHISDAGGRDATVPFHAVDAPQRPELGLPGEDVVQFQRYLAAAPGGLHAALVEAHGGDYAQALIDGDPEVELESVGRRIHETSVIYLSHAGEPLYASPQVVERLLSAAGEETERRAPVDVAANINGERALVWTGLRMPRREAARRFIFERAVRLTHTDGPSYDHLYKMAAELDGADEVALIGADGGRALLIFQANGSPWRGFLEGRVRGERYQLLLRLTRMELKRPAVDGGEE